MKKEIRNVCDLKERMKDGGYYHSESFDVWYRTPVPDFDYATPKEMMDNTDYKQLSKLMNWIEAGNLSIKASLNH